MKPTKFCNCFSCTDCQNYTDYMEYVIETEREKDKFSFEQLEEQRRIKNVIWTVFAI